MDKKRLVLEHAAMWERWPVLQPRLCRDSPGTKLWWELELRAEGGNRLPIKIAYPADYPASPPEIVVCKAVPPNTPHFFHSSRSICWRYPGEAKRNRNIWCPSKDTAAVCVGVAQRWFYAFLIWLSIKEWPVPDALDS